MLAAQCIASCPAHLCCARLQLSPSHPASPSLVQIHAGDSCASQRPSFCSACTGLHQYESAAAVGQAVLAACLAHLLHPQACPSAPRVQHPAGTGFQTHSLLQAQETGVDCSCEVTSKTQPHCRPRHLSRTGRAACLQARGARDIARAAGHHRSSSSPSKRDPARPPSQPLSAPPYRCYCCRYIQGCW